ncbi:hypothetical protein BDN71DRAFT_1433240 [Pleurotus eryngii]|uniref:Uncharacterized protein n=1 Tax=Pleurotus eryngii TaxID=5323 RepID=A0A9P5ZU97_PLEER|nr:hypothetical protein BDN71DRAFT_1433240 [Pleurotus eryngii]
MSDGVPHSTKSKNLPCWMSGTGRHFAKQADIFSQQVAGMSDGVVYNTKSKLSTHRLSGASQGFAKQADASSQVQAEVLQNRPTLLAICNTKSKMVTLAAGQLQADVLRDRLMLSAMPAEVLRNGPTFSATPQISGASRCFVKQANAFSCTQYLVQNLGTSDVWCQPTFGEMGQHFQPLACPMVYYIVPSPNCRYIGRPVPADVLQNGPMFSVVN